MKIREALINLKEHQYWHVSSFRSVPDPFNNASGKSVALIVTTFGHSKKRKGRFESKPAGDGSGRSCPAATFQLPLRDACRTAPKLACGSNSVGLMSCTHPKRQ